MREKEYSSSTLWYPDLLAFHWWSSSSKESLCFKTWLKQSSTHHILGSLLTADCNHKPNIILCFLHRNQLVKELRRLTCSQALPALAVAEANQQELLFLYQEEHIIKHQDCGY